MPDLNLFEIDARYRVEQVIALVAAKGERTDDLEEEAVALFLALAKHMNDQSER